MSTTTNITGLKRGEDIVLTVTIAGSGTIDGWTFEANLRDLKRNELVVTKTSGSGVTITDAPNRVIEVVIADTDTESLRSDTYLYDIWRTNDGLESCLCDGTIVLGRSARNG